MTDTQPHVRARARAEAKYRFFVHAGVYAGVMTLLVVVNLLTSSDALWFVWPLLGWGLALVLHGIGAFLSGGRSAVIDRMTERELRRFPADRSEGGA